MGGGNGQLDKRYLALAGLVIVVAVAASLWFFPEWRQSPALMIALVVLATVGVVGFAANFRQAFFRDQTPAQPAALDYDSPQHRHNQENITANVRSAWIDGVLSESLPERVRLELALESAPGMLRRTMVTAEGREPRRELVSGEHIADIFRASGRALLILGAPGSGKTITLLELCRPVLEGAEADPRRPVPVVLNLSTWAQKQAPLEDWIVDRMWPEYGLNGQVTRSWLAAGHLTLLLDGLDEVRPDARDGCVRAINAFRAKTGAAMVVCSRSADYAELSQRLALTRAVEILPLTPAQVDGYLGDRRLGLAAVREAIARDDALRELAETPLMLNVMAVAYGGRPFAELLPLLDDQSERRAHLYDAYLARMLRRKPLAGLGYSAAQALGWLRFLAGRLAGRDQTQFFIEEMQPDWLPSEQGGSLGALTYALIGVFVAVLYGFFIGWMTSTLFSMRVSVLAGAMGTVLLILPLIFEVLSSDDWASFTVDPVDELEIDFRPSLIGQAVKELGITLDDALGTLIFVLVIVLGFLLGDLWRFIYSGIMSAFLFAALAFGLPGLVIRLWFRTMFFVLGAGVRHMLGVVLFFALLLALVLILGVISATVLRPLESKRRDQPNQGIRRSAMNATRTGLIIGGLFGLLLCVLGLAFFGSSAVGLVGALIGGLLGGLIYGGAAVIMHYVLRLLLALQHLLPLRLIPFLEAMRGRIFLQRAGGQYRFIHRTFQDHLAGLTDERIAAIVAEAGQ